MMKKEQLVTTLQDSMETLNKEHKEKENEFMLANKENRQLKRQVTQLEDQMEKM